MSTTSATPEQPVGVPVTGASGPVGATGKPPLVAVPVKRPFDSRIFWLTIGTGLLWVAQLLFDTDPTLVAKLPIGVRFLPVAIGGVFVVVKLALRLSDPDIVTKIPWLDRSNARAPLILPEPDGDQPPGRE